MTVFNMFFLGSYSTSKIIQFFTLPKSLDPKNCYILQSTVLLFKSLTCSIPAYALSGRRCLDGSAIVACYHTAKLRNRYLLKIIWPFRKHLHNHTSVFLISMPHFLHLCLIIKHAQHSSSTTRKLDCCSHTPPKCHHT